MEYEIPKEALDLIVPDYRNDFIRFMNSEDSKDFDEYLGTNANAQRAVAMAFDHRISLIRKMLKE